MLGGVRFWGGGAGGEGKDWGGEGREETGEGRGVAEGAVGVEGESLVLIPRAFRRLIWSEVREGILGLWSKVDSTSSIVKSFNLGVSKRIVVNLDIVNLARKRISV